MPTGDLFRRLTISAQAAPSGPKLTQYLVRHQQRTGHGQRVETSDDRPFARPSTVRLELGRAASGKPVRYRLALERVDYLVGDDESRAVVSGATEIASGEVP